MDTSQHINTGVTRENTTNQQVTNWDRIIRETDHLNNSHYSINIRIRAIEALENSSQLAQAMKYYCELACLYRVPKIDSISQANNSVAKAVALSAFCTDRQTFELACSLYNIGHIREANQLFRKFTDIDDSRITMSQADLKVLSHHYLSYIHMKSKEYDRAMEEVQIASKYYPELSSEAKREATIHLSYIAQDFSVVGQHVIATFCIHHAIALTNPRTNIHEILALRTQLAETQRNAREFQTSKTTAQLTREVAGISYHLDPTTHRMTKLRAKINVALCQVMSGNRDSIQHIVNAINQMNDFNREADQTGREDCFNVQEIMHNFVQLAQCHILYGHLEDASELLDELETATLSVLPQQTSKDLNRALTDRTTLPVEHKTPEEKAVLRWCINTLADIKGLRITIHNMSDFLNEDLVSTLRHDRIQLYTLARGSLPLQARIDQVILSEDLSPNERSSRLREIFDDIEDSNFESKIAMIPYLVASFLDCNGLQAVANTFLNSGLRLMDDAKDFGSSIENHCTYIAYARLLHSLGQERLALSTLESVTTRVDRSTSLCHPDYMEALFLLSELYYSHDLSKESDIAYKQAESIRSSLADYNGGKYFNKNYSFK